MNQRKNSQKISALSRIRHIPYRHIRLAFIVVIGIGMSIVVGYQFWYQRTDKILRDAVVNTITADTVIAHGTMHYKSSEINLDITLDGKSGENGKAELDVHVEGSTNGGQAPSQNFKASGIGRILNGTIYMKLDTIGTIAENVTGQSGGRIPPFAPAIFRKLEGRWISIKASDYDNIYPTIARQQMCFSSLLKRIQASKSLLTELAPLYKKNQMIHIEKELGLKEVEGVQSFGYKITIDGNDASAFIDNIETTELGNALKSCNKDINFSKIASDAKNIAAGGENPVVIEIWVSVLGHEITSLSLDNIKIANGALSVTLKPDFNTSISVITPVESVPFKNVLLEIQHTILNYTAGRSIDEATPEHIPTDSPLQQKI